MSLSYCTNPPAISILLRSSPRLYIKTHLLGGGQCSIDTKVNFWTRSLCSLQRERRRLDFKWLTCKVQWCRRFERIQDTFRGIRGRVRRRFCSWGFWPFMRGRRIRLTVWSSLGFFTQCCFSCTLGTICRRGRQRQRKSWWVSIRCHRRLTQLQVRLPWSLWNLCLRSGRRYNGSSQKISFRSWFGCVIPKEQVCFPWFCWRLCLEGWVCLWILGRLGFCRSIWAQGCWICNRFPSQSQHWNLSRANSKSWY